MQITDNRLTGQTTLANRESPLVAEMLPISAAGTHRTLPFTSEQAPLHSALAPSLTPDPTCYLLSDI